MNASRQPPARPDDPAELAIMRHAGGGARARRAAGQLRGPAREPAGRCEAAALEALEELSDWELDAMRDPRNWVRPVAALAVGTAAGAALVVLRLRRTRRRRPPGLRGLAEQGGNTVSGAVSSARSLIR